MHLKPGKNIRLFQSELLERLTYVHPAVPIAVWGPLVTYWFCRGVVTGELSLLASAGLFLVGLAAWTPSEYLLHRFIFHFNARGPLGRRLVFLFHGNHHEDPGDERRLLMPPLAAILIASVFHVLFGLALGPTIVRPFFAGFITGYLFYDYIHFATHFSGLRPPAWMAPAIRKLKKNHLRHHFVAEDKLYGVSSPFWDHVFGTRA